MLNTLRQCFYMHSLRHVRRKTFHVVFLIREIVSSFLYCNVCFLLMDVCTIDRPFQALTELAFRESKAIRTVPGILVCIYGDWCLSPGRKGLFANWWTLACCLVINQCCSISWNAAQATLDWPAFQRVWGGMSAPIGRFGRIRLYALSIELGGLVRDTKYSVGTTEIVLVPTSSFTFSTSTSFQTAVHQNFALAWRLSLPLRNLAWDLRVFDLLTSTFDWV